MTRHQPNLSPSMRRVRYGLAWLLACSLVLLIPSPAVQAQSAQSQPDPTRLELGSVAAIVYDVDKKTPLYSQFADSRLPIASLSKLMTALVVLESGADLDERLTIKPYRNGEGKNGYSRIRPQSTLKRRDLLRLGLMASENRATYTLAHAYPGGMPAFIQKMNQRASALGMTATHFTDAAGLSVRNESTARDMVKLLVALDRFPIMKTLSTARYFRANFRKPRYGLDYGNTNRLVHRSSWDIEVSKTGYLKESGRCLALLTHLKGRKLAIVLLDSFGKLTHISDAVRVRRWLETGASGMVARAALRYRQHKREQLGLIPQTADARHP